MEKEVAKKKPRTIQVKIGNQAAKTMTPDEAASYLKTIASANKEVKMTFGKQQQQQQPKQRNSEKEMKALMSMFVEIMGLSMNTDKLNKPSLQVKKPFQFPPDLPPPPGGWPQEFGSPTDDSSNSLPDLEDIQENDRPKKKESSQTTIVPSTTATPQPVSGLAGIAPFEWEALERVAIEDALEQEERARKAAKKRGDKSKTATRKKEQVKKNVSEEVAKKQKKAILSWRSRVASACQSNEVETLNSLLQESPLKKDVKQHLEILVPHVVPRNRQSLEKGRECREALASFIISLSAETLFVPLRNGRSVLHTACFYNDRNLLQQVLEQENANLEVTCQDSGWTPLQYATMSGSMHAVELLLARGVNLTTLTSDTHTWKTSNGKGIHVQELVDAVVTGKFDKEIETHGMALEEATKDFMSNASDRRRFLTLLGKIADRLKDVESNGYSPLEQVQIVDFDDIVDEESAQRKELKEAPSNQKQESAVNDDTDTSASKQGKKQPPKKKPPPASRASSEASKAAAEDPVITALKGMGFPEVQILAGVRACGGIDRATADDVVAWIFGQDAGEGGPQEVIKSEKASAKKGKFERGSKRAASSSESRSRSNSASEKKRFEAAKRAEEQRIAAEKLAAKREEQRRRNREWNNRQAQVRQQQDAQASRTIGGLAPASNFLPAVNTTATATSTQKSSYGLKPPPSAATWNADHMDNGNDASTVASSNEHGSVEIGNDDATVSTMGSVPTRSTSVSAQSTPVAQPGVPPGFTSSVAAVPESRPMEVSQPWDASRSMMQPRHESLLPPPPGIPESRPFVDMSGHPPPMPGSSFTGATLPPRQDMFASGSSSLLGTSFASGAPASSSPLMGSSGLFTPSTSTSANVFDRMVGPPAENVSPVPHSVASSVSGPSVPTPLGFGLESQKNGHALDSSVIDSISTGGSAIGGATLWGDHSAAPSGPSLLGNLIQTNSFREGEQQDSLFSSQHSSHDAIGAPERWGQGRQSSFHGSGHLNTGSGSIW